MSFDESSAYMSLTSVLGPSRSALDKWQEKQSELVVQRSIKSRISVSPKILSGAANRKQVDCPLVHIQKKKPHFFKWSFVFALLIFPSSRPLSIVSVHELNFCVRDGNRWTLMTINTNSLWVAFNHLLYLHPFG